MTPLVMLVDDQEWTARSLEAILRPRGHVVLRAFTGQQALELVERVSPDVLLVDLHLPDIDGIDLMRRLQESATIHPTTPALIVTSSAVGRAERLEALNSGAWDILVHPIDPNELILRMDTFVRAKQAADRVRDEGLTDTITGFYNVRGILRRAKEMGADAARYNRPLTFVAFGPHASAESGSNADHPEPVDASEVGAPVASALREVTRISDAIGRLGPGEFIVVAPGTDGGGAQRLADRVLEAIEKGDRESTHMAALSGLARISAGFSSMSAEADTRPEDLLLRATMALRRAQADEASSRVRAYEA